MQKHLAIVGIIFSLLIPNAEAGLDKIPFLKKGKVSKGSDGGAKQEEQIDQGSPNPLSDASSQDQIAHYYDDTSLKELAKKGSKLIFFSTGWSGSGIGKLYKRKNKVKQSRGFAIAYSLALRMNKLGIPGKVYYLTTQSVSEYQRRYYYDLHMAEEFSQNEDKVFQRDILDRNEKFAEFEKNYFELIKFSSNDLIRNLPANDLRRYFYLFEGKNAPKIVALRETVSELRAQGAVFGGFEYHFGGSYFQALKAALNLPEMPLLGSEIYEAEGHDEDTDDSDSDGEGRVSRFIRSFSTDLEEEKIDIPRDLGTKSQCRRLYREVGVPHPQGSYFPVHDVDTLVSELYDFMWKNKNILKYVVKLERSAAGDGNKTYDFTEISKVKNFWTDKSIGTAEIKTELRKQFTETDAYERRIHDHGAVFEALISGEHFNSPAVLGMITPKAVDFYFDYDQLLGGPTGQIYMGSMGPTSKLGLEDKSKKGATLPEADLKTPTLKILEGLRQCGARGPVGVDFVTCDEIDENGNKVRGCYAIENNVRHTGTMYPYRTARFLLGKEVMEKKFFASTDSVPVKVFPRGQNLNVRRWFYGEHLKGNPYAYNSLTQTGCLIYMDTWALGKMGIACVGDTEQSTRELFEGFKTTITEDVARYVRNLR